MKWLFIVLWSRSCLLNTKFSDIARIIGAYHNSAWHLTVHKTLNYSNYYVLCYATFAITTVINSIQNMIYIVYSQCTRYINIKLHTNWCGNSFNTCNTWTFVDHVWWLSTFLSEIELYLFVNSSIILNSLNPLEKYIFHSSFTISRVNTKTWNIRL